MIRNDARRQFDGHPLRQHPSISAVFCLCFRGSPNRSPNAMAGCAQVQADRRGRNMSRDRTHCQYTAYALRDPLGLWRPAGAGAFRCRSVSGGAHGAPRSAPTNSGESARHGYDMDENIYTGVGFRHSEGDARIRNPDPV